MHSMFEHGMEIYMGSNDELFTVFEPGWCVWRWIPYWWKRLSGKAAGTVTTTEGTIWVIEK